MTNSQPRNIRELDPPEDVCRAIETARPELASAVDFLRDPATSEGD